MKDKEAMSDQEWLAEAIEAMKQARIKKERKDKAEIDAYNLYWDRRLREEREGR